MVSNFFFNKDKIKKKLTKIGDIIKFIKFWFIYTQTNKMIALVKN